mmetsp:Transcript_14652/g.22762  ORF Transcript_14652/g.22762 Transcript_14652/m.22762 type:complete len:363 (-) Transcript_14652:154-1242(-)
MGGRISFRSQENVGTVVTAKVRLPLAEGDQFRCQPSFALQELQGVVHVAMVQKPSSRLVLETCREFGLEVEDLSYKEDSRLSQKDTVLEMLRADYRGVIILDFEMYRILIQQYPEIGERKVLVTGDLAVQVKAVEGGKLDEICFLALPIKVSAMHARLRQILSDDFKPKLDSKWFRRIHGEEDNTPQRNSGAHDSRNRNAEDASKSRVSATDNHQNNGKPHFRILVVDDHPPNQKVASAMVNKVMGKANCLSIDFADDGMAALTKVTGGGNDYDLILLDIQMPQMDGIECCKRIREWENIEGRANVPRRHYILAMTALSGEDDMKDCFMAGMDDFCSKPLGLKIVKEKLDSFKQWMLRSSSR